MKTIANSPYQLFRIIILLFLVIICSCNKSEDENEINLSTFEINNYPRIDGSTSTHPLQSVIACNLLGIEFIWGQSWFDETYRIWPIPDEKPETAQYIRDSITHNGTHSAYVNLISDSADVILVARPPSVDEINLADSLGVELIVEPIALDAFVFIANVNNPVNSLTVKQIQDIYMGNITNWSVVGGLDTIINPYTRNRNSGSQELMESLVMKDLTIPQLPSVVIHGMMGTINKVSIDNNGLSFTVYFYEQFMAANDGLKLLGLNDVIPGYNTIKSKKYLYTTEVYSVIRKDLNHSSNAYNLFFWLQSSDGQRVIAESGYVPYE